MRIVAGKWAGRHLTSPGPRVRPTAEAVRDRWITLLERELKGARVLELFAGTGALGLESLSRGARSVDFVENGAASLHSLKANIAALHARDRTRVFKRDALPWAAALEEGTYDVCLADPPYETRMLDRLIEIWQETYFATILAVEHAEAHELPRGGRLYSMEGQTAVTVFRAPPGRGVPPAPAE